MGEPEGKPVPSKKLRTAYPLYQLWENIKQRCYNPNNGGYEWYGRKGVELYEPWHTFQNFNRDVLSEIGPKPGARHSIDRIDNRKGYIPGNLRWATPDQQTANRHNVSFLRVDGRDFPLHNAFLHLGLTTSQAISARASLRTYSQPLAKVLARFGIDPARVADLRLAPSPIRIG
jgi:hypothetical protein